MVVEKVSPKIPLTNNFVLSGQNEKPITPQISQPETKKGNKNILWWTLGGLAVASTAGILIYKARKGRIPNSNGFQLGDFAKKFVDTSILTNTLERAKSPDSRIRVQANANKTTIEFFDEAKNFGARIISKFDNNAEGKLSEFNFATGGLNLNVVNFENNLTHLNFALSDTIGFALKVDSKTGKVIQEVDKSVDDMKFLMPRVQKLVDDLDPKKLLDDDGYRDNYVVNLHETLKDVQYDKVAAATGKTFDEVKNFANGEEFKGMRDAGHKLMQLSHLFGFSTKHSNLVQNLVEGGESHILEKMIKGEFKPVIMFNETIDGMAETGIPKQICSRVTLNDGDVTETFKFSDNYYEIERQVKSSPSDYFRIKLHDPEKVTEHEFTSASIHTSNSGFSYTIKQDDVFEFALLKDGKKIELNDAMKAELKDGLNLHSFIQSFIEKGDENIDELLKLKNGSD